MDDIKSAQKSFIKELYIDFGKFIDISFIKGYQKTGQIN